jgi:hypothetical protein
MQMRPDNGMRLDPLEAADCLERMPGKERL